MKILVTGGAGFIGSHLVDSLVKKGHTITVIDDLSSGSREYLPDDVKIIEGNVTDEGVFDDLVQDIDACFHLAAISSVEESRHNWLAAHRTNACGIVNLFDTLSRHKKKIPVIFTSSASTYGEDNTLPLSEHAPTKPASAYGADKAACEMYAKIAFDIHGIPNIGLRLFNVYGPRQQRTSAYSGVIPIFLDKITKEEPITIYGDGSDTRDYIYITDVIQSLHSALNILQVKKIEHNVFNICTGESTTVGELAKAIARIANKSLTIDHAPERRGHIRHSLGYTSRATSVLGFQTTTTLTEGLTKMYELL